MSTTPSPILACCLVACLMSLYISSRSSALRPMRDEANVATPAYSGLGPPT